MERITEFLPMDMERKWIQNRGPNGASIILPAEGRHLCDGALERSSGYYWSASPFVKDNLILTFDNLFFTTSTVMFYYSSPCNQYSIRLIQMR